MVKGWLEGCWETNCEEMIRLRSIVASRLEPKSRREMEDAAIIAYTASLVSTERSHVPSVDRATLIKVTVQRKIPKALLLSSTGSSSASWSRPIETSALASTDWFPPALHLRTGPFLYRASASTDWFPQTINHGSHWGTAVSSSPPPKSALD